MSRKSRTQRQRAAARRASAADGAPTPATRSTPAAREKRGDVDPLELYRSMAAPSPVMRGLLMLGLVLYIAADSVSLADSKAVNAAASLSLFGLLAIMVFLGSGFVRHQRALFRIRREHPGAWPSSMGFAMSTLPIPLGFGGKPADSRERSLRRITMFLLLAFAVAAVANSTHR